MNCSTLHEEYSGEWAQEFIGHLQAAAAWRSTDISTIFSSGLPTRPPLKAIIDFCFMRAFRIFVSWRKPFPQDCPVPRRNRKWAMSEFECEDLNFRPFEILAWRLISNGSNRIWPSATFSGDARPGFIARFWKIEAFFHQRPERNQEIWIISLQLPSRTSFDVEILRDMLEKLRKAYLDTFLRIKFLSMRAGGDGSYVSEIFWMGRPQQRRNTQEFLWWTFNGGHCKHRTSSAIYVGVTDRPDMH